MQRTILKKDTLKDGDFVMYEDFEDLKQQLKTDLV